MKSYLISYTVAVVAFLILDGLWLGVVAQSFYVTHMDSLLRENILILPALLFYFVYTAGIVVFAVRPGQEPKSLVRIAAHGALLGFMAYGTYDMTNLATLRGWSVWLSLVDVVWGTLLSATVALISGFSLRIVK
ncbi:MAG: DUF2177 family protein [Granulosicoccus sp.]|nr:DUF2177 family protein [Granulosicoccus sp.]